MVGLYGAPGKPLAPYAGDRGPKQVLTAEYKFDAKVDVEVLDFSDILDFDAQGQPVQTHNNPREVELWARVWWPADISQTTTPYPLVVFLHGNHGTCGLGSLPRVDGGKFYSYYGTCPGKYNIIVPNHEGYAYLADQLASWGYVVVSINSNRGINSLVGATSDLYLIAARGKLALRHLQLWHAWNTTGALPNDQTFPYSTETKGFNGAQFLGKIDFSNVGLMGHSRGGEGVRDAYNRYRNRLTNNPWPNRIPNMTIKAIFEIGPTDGLSLKRGAFSGAGAYVPNLLNAGGAVWNVLIPMCDGDVYDLMGIRPFDRMLRTSVSPSLQKSIYAVWGANHNFYNTEWQTVDRGSSRCDGLNNISLQALDQRETALATVLAFFRGNLGPNATPAFNLNFETTWATIENISAFKTLDLRVSRQHSNSNTAPSTDFSIYLVYQNSSGSNVLSQPVKLNAYADLRGPVGACYPWPDPPTPVCARRPVLQTARIPLTDFVGANLSQARGIRLAFDDPNTPTGAIYVANIRFSK